MQSNRIATRVSRLEDLAKQCIEIYDDATRAALDGDEDCGRYALLTCEGSPESTYRDNPNLTVHNTPADLASAAQFELDGGWGILSMTDLDTGKEIDWEIKVVIA